MSNRVLNKLEPARSVLAFLGKHADPKLTCERARIRRGIGIAREATGRTEATIYKWMYEQAKGGTGGRVPQSDQSMLLRYAAVNKIGLTPADFFPVELLKTIDRRKPKGARRADKESARSTG